MVPTGQGAESVGHGAGLRHRVHFVHDYKLTVPTIQTLIYKYFKYYSFTLQLRHYIVYLELKINSRLYTQLSAQLRIKSDNV